MAYRNRYRIASAGGPLLLSVPLQGGRRQGTALADTHIDYTHAWQRRHWRTILSAYGRAPFFEHYAPELEALITVRYDRLADFNHAGIRWLCKALQMNIAFTDTQDMHRPAGAGYIALARPAEYVCLPAYHQVFEDRLGFLPDLSVIDLLLNEGPYAGQYIRRLAR